MGGIQFRVPLLGWFRRHGGHGLRRRPGLGDIDDVGPVRGECQCAGIRRRRGCVLLAQLPHALVEGVDLDRQAVYPQLGHGFAERAQAAPFLRVERDRDVRTVAEDLRDRAGQNGPRAVFDEHPHTVFPGLEHGGREIDGLQRLSRDRFGGGFPGRGVGAVHGVGVEPDVGSRVGLAGVDGAPRVGERSDRLTVDDHVQTQRHRPRAVDRVDDPAARRGIPADHAVVGGLHDRHVRQRLGLQCPFHRRPRRGDPPVLPRGGQIVEPPGLRRHPALPGQLVAVHPRRLDLVEHRLQVLPDTERQ
ncbi:hypothetical protein MPP7335_04027 [Mycolicibacterium parafortuitum]|uniref:Uncharacterized protein n=1 Tax=Mycolicibacterium parafortuitum TaxID=39692 RepID=A0A375YM73_MYCPF|nr:hypothetical protein MPP7335_04027 [Mycolicibacterium parafortuitum]